MNSLAFTPVSDLTVLLRTGELSPVELLDIFLERIAELNPALNAYLTIAEDRARHRAMEAEVILQKGQDPMPCSAGQWH